MPPVTLDTMPERLTPSEVAAFLGISVDAVMNFRDSGSLEFIDISSPGVRRHTMRITKASVAAFVAKRSTGRKTK